MSRAVRQPSFLFRRRSGRSVPLASRLAARNLVVAEFVRQFIAANGHAPVDIAVVGGDRNEPEILALQEAGIQLTIRTFGVDDRVDERLDLNQREVRGADYGLVLCSQVLEHVWNHQTAFMSLASLVRPGGLLWVACPASNFEHASPEYYSAGFSPAYLRANLEKVGFDVYAAGQIGSERLYFMTHVIGTWPSDVQYRKPIRHALLGLNRGKLEMFIRMVPVILLGSEFTANPRWATEAWALGRRRSDSSTASNGERTPESR